MVVRCVAKNGTKAWYNANKDQIFADFGTLYSAQMSIDGIDARTGEAYDDMVLVENKAYIYGREEVYLVEFTYETLTDSFVKEQEDKVDFDLNGLKRLTRTIIAKDTVAYSSVVGTTTLGSAPTLTLAQSVEDQLEPSEDGFKRIQEVWLESGTLSETLDNVGSQKAKVIETIGADPATPSGYSLASKQESNLEGFQTNRFTFLKPSILSLKQELSGGSKEVSVQAFGLNEADVITALSEVTSDHVLLSQSESDYAGIKTTTFEFRLDESFTEDYELNGLQRISLVELSVSNFTAQTIGSVSSSAPTSGLYLGTQQIDNGGSIKVRESIWLEAGVLNASKEFNRDGLLYVTFYSQGSKVTPTALNSGKLLTDIETEAFQGGVDAPVRYSKVQDVNGFKKFQVTVMLLQDGSPLVGGGADNAVQSYQQYEKYKRPGTFTLAADAVTGSPGNTRDVLVTVTEVISTDSTLAASYKPFSVTNWTDYNYRYIPTSTGLPVVKNGAADGYLGSGSFASAGGEVFGVEVDSAVGTAGSNPSPTAFNNLSNQVISSSNDPAFTTDEGVKWYRKIKVQMVGTMAANLGSV